MDEIEYCIGGMETKQQWTISLSFDSVQTGILPMRFMNTMKKTQRAVIPPNTESSYFLKYKLGRFWIKQFIQSLPSVFFKQSDTERCRIFCAFGGNFV